MRSLLNFVFFLICKLNIDFMLNKLLYFFYFFKMGKYNFFYIFLLLCNVYCIFLKNIKK